MYLVLRTQPVGYHLCCKGCNSSVYGIRSLKHHVAKSSECLKFWGGTIENLTKKARMELKKQYKKQHYIRNQEKLKELAKQRYMIDSERVKNRVSIYYHRSPQKHRDREQRKYRSNPQKQRDRKQQEYIKDPKKQIRHTLVQGL